MKKVLVLCLVLVMAFSVSITAFAAGAFISSPSRNDAPTLVSSENEDENCTADLKITSYSDRGELSSDEKDGIEQAYGDISSTEDLTTLNDDLKNLAEKNGVKGNHLGVSDLFNIGYTDCDNHNDHGAFSINLDADTLNNFFALMRHDGENWHLVDNAKVENGNLVFNSKELGNFAVVAKHSAPQTGDMISIFFVSTVVLGIALAVVLVSLKKKSVA